MIDGKFDVIFRGQIVKGFDLATVQQNMVNLFKSSPDAVARLFSGSEVVIRKDIDYAAAMKYQSALKGAGALALIKEVESQQSKQESASPKAAYSGKASFGETEEPLTDKPQKEVTTTTKSVAIESATQTTSIKPSDVEQLIKSQTEDPQDAGNLTMAEVGAQILPKREYKQREVDTSEFSLATVGERLLPKKEPVKHPQPNIDHLSLD